MWKRVTGYGAALAAGTLALQSLDYLRLVRAYPGEVYAGLIAIGFLVLGIYLGAKVIAPRSPMPVDGNPKAQASLGISPRELTVLQALAAGQSNKEVARELGVSPNTIKTHISRLFEKLGAKRRTDAIARARDLGVLP